MAEKFLDKAYALEGAAATEKLYDTWSATYDDEVGENGYATPARCAAALMEFLPDPAAPILDFGCGTGLSGLALTLAGAKVIDGMDLSAEMLKGAKDKGVYRTLTRIDAGAPLPFNPGDYAAIAAIGVIGVGAAPLDTFDTLLAGLAPGGYLVFSFNDHALDDPNYEARVNAAIDAGTARLLIREYGDHLPGINLKSMVYVLEKL